MLSCLHLVDLKTRRGHKKFQKSYASNLNKRPNWCQLLCLHFSGMHESSTHSCHRPQNTAIACPLVTNGKTNRCLLGTLHPAKGEQWFYCYSQKKNCWNKGKTTVSHVLRSHDTSNALKWRIPQNPDYISRRFLTQVQIWVVCLHCIWTVWSGMFI